MRKNTRKNIIALLFLTIFFLVRVGNAHTFSHFSNDDDTHCELCQIIFLGNQLTPLLDNTTDEFEFKNVIKFSEGQSNPDYESPRYCFVTPVSFLNKPPPRIIPTT